MYPTSSLSPLYTLLLFEWFALLLPLLWVWFRPTFTVLASIIYNHSACLSSVFVCVSIRYCHLNTSLVIVYLNHIFHHHHHFCLSSGFGSDFKIIISLFLLFSFSPPPHTHYHLFHHDCGSQCCYYCFMCSIWYWHVDQQGQIVRIGNCLKS